MKKEEFVSGLVMLIVSVMVLVGVTIAWFSASDNVLARGMKIKAAEPGSLKIALNSGGEDISVLAEDDNPDNEYADIGLAALTNIENGKLAPGAFGKVTFFITPSKGVTKCNITSLVQIRQGTGTWYPDIEGKTEGSTKIRTLCEQVGRHISFYSDEAMTRVIDEDNPYQLIWADGEAETEKEAVIYWIWHYEYPFTQDESDSLTDEQKKALIDLYDEEDTSIGKNISSMKFHFMFSVQ